MPRLYAEPLMPPAFAASCLPLPPAILPHTAPAAAWQAVLNATPELVLWPVLPRRGPREMLWSWSAEGFPGLAKEQPLVESKLFEAQIERLYLAYLEGRLAEGAIQTVERALVSPPWQEEALAPTLMLGAQLMGPISLGLLLLDEQDQSLLQSREQRDALAKHLYLRAAWLETAFGRLAPASLICLDEPFLDALQSPFCPLQWAEARTLLEDVFAGLSGYRGLIPGRRVDWAALLQLPIDLVVCQEEEAERLLAASEALASYLERGGVVTWALVPTDEGMVDPQAVQRIVARFEDLLRRAEARGVSPEQLTAGALITVGGGLDHLSTARAERTLGLLEETSALLQQRYHEPGSTEA